MYEHCDESNWGSYGISFFIFGIPFQQYVRKTGPKKFELDIWLNQFMSEGAAFKLKVIRLGRQPWFLGAPAFRRPPAVGEDGPKSAWIMGSPGARTNSWVKPVMHAHYPDAGIKAERSVDYDQWTPPDTEEESDQAARFARDYRTLFQRSEAEMQLRAIREVPVLDVIQEGSAMLSEVMDGVRVEPLATTGPEGPVRIVVSILAVLGLRSARAFNLLIGAGYVPEAASTVGRMQSVARVAGQVRDDETGVVALQLLQGAAMRDLDPEGWEDTRAAMEAHLGQMPSVGAMPGQGEIRPRLPFAGQRDSRRETYLGNLALVRARRHRDDRFHHSAGR